jgi:hypothetical protein
VRLGAAEARVVPDRETKHFGATGSRQRPRQAPYAPTFDPYFRCAACFETPSIVPISDQLR